MPTGGLDLDFDDAQLAIREALAQFCAERCSDEARKALENGFSRELWRELAELGVLALLTPEGEGGAVELVAALEALGARLFPGPLVETFLATQLVEGEARAALAGGAAVVSLGAPPLLPWAPYADLFVELAGERAFLAAPRGAVEPVETLGGEPWGRVELERRQELAGLARARVVHDTARAAYLAAAGLRLVEDTAEHARTRKQFGRALGEFQAVAHPLADCWMRLLASQTLARAAACHFDAGDEALARRHAAAARLSAARNAVDAAHTAHQLFGAVGITLEGPVFHVSRRIRQLASQLPGEEVPREALLEPLAP